MKTIEEIVDDWAKSPVMPMNDFFINPETENYRKWAEVPGCYRIVEDPSLSVTLYVGEGSRLYRVYAHPQFRTKWVQMIAIMASPEDRDDWNDYQRQFLFRRKVEDAGAAGSVRCTARSTLDTGTDASSPLQNASSLIRCLFFQIGILSNLNRSIEFTGSVARRPGRRHPSLERSNRHR